VTLTEEGGFKLINDLSLSTTGATKGDVGTQRARHRRLSPEKVVDRAV